MIWGEKVWSSIHYIALAYPDNPSFQDKQNYINFFNALGFVLPCQKCRINYQNHLRELPVELYIENNKLFEWTVKMHNTVNLENGKPTWTVEQAKSFYLKKYDEKPPTSYLTITTIILLIMFIIIILIWQRNKFLI
jgi:hypothetical protein